MNKHEVLISEVGPRDGLQSVKATMATADKLRWIDALHRAGVREIEVASFVPARRLPQMADAAEVVRHALTLPNLTVMALVPNLKGAEAALREGVHKLTIPVSASAAHCLANVRKTREEMIEEVRAIAELRRTISPHIKVEAGISMTHVPYKGTNGAQLDLLAGRISVLFDNLPNGLANARSGRVKALGVTSAQRWATAPDLPTLAEGGYPGATIISTFGLMAPVGTPSVIINKLSAALQKGLQDEKVRKSIIDSGSEPGALGPKEYASYIGEETKRWTRFLEQHPEISVE